MTIFFPFIILQIGTLIFWWILWLFCYPSGFYVSHGDASNGSTSGGATPGDTAADSLRHNNPIKRSFRWRTFSKIGTSSFVRGCVLMLFLGFFIGWAVQAPKYYWPRARVASQEAYLYIGPEKDFPKRAILTGSEQIVIEQKKEGWYYVSTSQGKGWVQATDVAVEGDTHDLT